MSQMCCGIEMDRAGESGKYVELHCSSCGDVVFVRKMAMKGTISNMLMGGLIASIIMVGAIYGMNSLFSFYNPAAVQNDTAFNKISDFSNNAEQLQGKLQGSGTNILVAAEVILTGGWSALLMLLNTPSLLFDLFASSANATGIQWPAWVFAGALALVTLYFVLKITGIATKSSGAEM